MRNIAVFLERLFRNAFVYPVLRRIFKNPKVVLPLEGKSLQSILILRYDKIGDMLVTLPIFRIVKTHFTGVRLSVVASEANAAMLRGEDSVDRVFVLYRNPLKLAREWYRIRQAHPDVVLNFVFNRITSGGLIVNLLCPHSVKVGQGPEKYGFYFNALLSLPRKKFHMFEMLVMYVEAVFGITVDPGEKYLQYPMDASAVSGVEGYLGRHGLRSKSGHVISSGRPYVVFNISAGQNDNRISSEQALSIGKHLSVELGVISVVIASPIDDPWKADIVSQIASERCLSFPDKGSSSLGEIIVLIEGALAVVTPHTSIVHIAAATSTPVCGLYSPLQVNEEWLPYNVTYRIIEAEQDQPVRTIPVGTLTREIRSFLTPIIENAIRTQR
ncbi:MAG TPA: glycosyltransferase family 9 protein [Bacteroidota bacterium]